MITVNGKQVETAMSIETLVLYEQEFDGKDMIADLNGKVTADDVKEEESEVIFDFSSIPWLKIMQGTWAMVKTANPSTPRFAKWAKEVKEVNTFELRGELIDAMENSFFHTAPEDGEGDGEEQE